MTFGRVRSNVRLLGILSFWLFVAGCSKAPPPPEEQHSAPVKAVAAQNASLEETTDLIGSTQPLPGYASRVTAAVEGRVVSLSQESANATIVEGQRVTKGQVIVQLDDTIARANRNKVRANQKDLEELKNQAVFAVELARIEVNRLEGIESRASSRDLGPALSKTELPKARIALKDALSKEKSAEARWEAGKAELKAIEDQLSLYSLRSPIAGRLELIQVVPGQTLAIGAMVAEVINLDEVDVLCYAPPVTALKLVLGQPARILDPHATEPGPLDGKVVYIALQGQADTGNFAVKVRFPNKKQILRANTVAQVQVVVKAAQNRLAIPETALMEDKDPPEVVVVQDVETKKDENGKEEKVGKAHKLQARLGARDRDKHLVEILELEDTEKKTKLFPKDVLFIIEGGHGLHDDDPVKLEEEEEHKEDKAGEKKEEAKEEGAKEGSEKKPEPKEDAKSSDKKHAPNEEK